MTIRGSLAKTLDAYLLAGGAIDINVIPTPRGRRRTIQLFVTHSGETHTFNLADADRANADAIAAAYHQAIAGYLTSGG